MQTEKTDLNPNIGINRSARLGGMMLMAQYRIGLAGVIALLIALACLENNAYADGFDDKDFSLRFPAALSRYSSYADVAATGGASAGSKWQSSVNPASTGWQSIPSRYHFTLSPQYSSIIFREGTILHVIAESVTKDFEEFGTFQVGLHRFAVMSVLHSKA